eukprot:538336-Pelagomonas_calceolata.AAC.3
MFFALRGECTHVQRAPPSNPCPPPPHRATSRTAASSPAAPSLLAAPQQPAPCMQRQQGKLAHARVKLAAMEAAVRKH